MIETNEERIIAHAANMICEHFDTVQIFVTRHNGGERTTTELDCGDGNIFARYGQVRKWLMRQDAKTKHEAIEENEQ